MIDRKALIETAVSKWGAPYKFGAKWPLNSEDPPGSVDCSGFTRWVYAQNEIDIPEGSTAQHAASTQETFVLPGDLVFLHTPLGPNDEHHVGMVYDAYFIIEARGVIVDGNEIGYVQLRSRKEWEARPDFVGYFRPKSVTAIEGA